MTLDTGDGNGVLLSVEATERECRRPRTSGRSAPRVGSDEIADGPRSTPKRVRETPLLEEFNLDADVKGQKAPLQYYVAKQAHGGVTVAARMTPGDGAADLRRSRAHRASLEVTRK